MSHYSIHPSDLLNARGLVRKSPSLRYVVGRCKESGEGAVSKVFYGETFDDGGDTVDSMKYYFFVSMLSSGLNEMGHKTKPVVLVADSAVCRNFPEDERKKYMGIGAQRSDFIKRVASNYRINLDVVRMSDYIDTPEFQNKVAEVTEYCKKDQKLMKMIEQSVPEDRLEAEKLKGFAYSFDELATIEDIDFKVGPPREDLYDRISREIASRRGSRSPDSIFLEPSFPVGLNWNFFFKNEQIEKYGITAYKANSSGLGRFRIIIGKTDSHEADKLIRRSYVPKNPKLPNPVLDLGIISEMARILVDKKPGKIDIHEMFYSGQISVDQLKARVSEGLSQYIIQRF